MAKGQKTRLRNRPVAVLLWAVLVIVALVVLVRGGQSLLGLFEAKRYLARGTESFGKGDFEQAIAAYSKAIELDPGYVVAYNNRGAVYNVRGDHERAIADFSKAIELDPDFTEAYAQRGQAYLAQGDLEGAIADFYRYLELRPNANDRQLFEDWIAALEAQLSEP